MNRCIVFTNTADAYVDSKVIYIFCL